MKTNQNKRRAPFLILSIFVITFVLILNPTILRQTVIYDMIPIVYVFLLLKASNKSNSRRIVEFIGFNIVMNLLLCVRYSKTAYSIYNIIFDLIVLTGINGIELVLFLLLEWLKEKAGIHTFSTALEKRKEKKIPLNHFLKSKHPKYKAAHIKNTNDTYRRKTGHYKINENIHTMNSKKQYNRKNRR